MHSVTTGPEFRTHTVNGAISTCTIAGCGRRRLGLFGAAAKSTQLSHGSLPDRLEAAVAGGAGGGGRITVSAA